MFELKREIRLIEKLDRNIDESKEGKNQKRQV